MIIHKSPVLRSRIIKYAEYEIDLFLSGIDSNVKTNDRYGERLRGITLFVYFIIWGRVFKIDYISVHSNLW